MDFDGTNHLFIEAENLEALKILQKAYAGSVKMIYIDPPYNTGSDSFIYPDKFSETREEYARRVGDKDDEGYLKRDGVFKGAWRKNSKESGHYHSNWLSMMLPRLHLAKTLLRDDGVIFISIDDNEQAQLKLLCDEVFGAENFLGNVIWQKKYAATNDAKGFSTLHDYILVYQKSLRFERNLLPRTETQNKPYKNDDNDGRGLWRSDNLLVKSFSESAVYPIRNPNTGIEYFPPQGSSWRASKATMQIWLQENRIFFGKDGQGAPQLKRYLNEVQQGRVPTTWWPFEEVGHNDAANKELQNLFNSKAPFDTPKPTTLLKQMFQIGSNPNDLILDFFSGSGTTAHAVMQLNAEDGGNRRYICVQLPEETDEKSEARKAGFDTIADIAKERIRRAGRQIREQHPEKTVDTGFKVFKLAESHFKPWRPSENGSDGLEAQLAMFIDPVAEHAEPLNMAYELMLRLGLKLTCPLHISDGVYWVEDEDTGKRTALLLTCADEHLIDAVIAENPAKVVALDRLFDGNDSLKSNTVLQMRDAGIIFECV
ncbi:site-specific DNA-methyltransferase [Neisseria zoodegmatis]|uniref:site-specific DNA-methyltransferase (adenine-specific) n=1 Tax=Neisseria zoodegmatis TaxID=326523 RepID=A0AB38DR54_9NEIS|nr:site-specific DNA-methyltransferase [Neisseria zoodegmatis]OSI11612.1 site-specific DNA-methyltransferase [Neisseria zoodegmatis]SNU79832.1 type iii restriction-modification system methyltransferase [Neisseria zoodegmatis]